MGTGRVNGVENLRRRGVLEQLLKGNKQAVMCNKVSTSEEGSGSPVRGQRST